MINDLRFAIRGLLRHRWVSAVIIVTLGLGIGINATVFTLLNTLLFKPVPVPRGDRIVVVSSQKRDEPAQRPAVSFADFEAFRTRNQTFEALEGLVEEQAIINEPEVSPQRLSAARVTPGLFDLLRTMPIAGRNMTTSDAVSGNPVVALISYDVWQSRYNGEDVRERNVLLNGQPATIVGVMPPKFKFPNNEDVWLPLQLGPAQLQRDQRFLQLFGVLKPGVGVHTAQADLARIAAEQARALPEFDDNLTANVQTFHAAYNGGKIKVIFILMQCAAGFVLLIACANVANLMLSQFLARGKEMALRAAIGATRWRLARLCIMECTLLCCLAGGVGLALSLAGVRAFDLATTNVGKPYWIQFTTDGTAVVFSATIALLCGVALGLLSSLRAAPAEMRGGLKESTFSGGTVRSSRLTTGLIIVQFALTLVLLAGAGLMIRTYFAAREINAFVHPERVYTARLQLSESASGRYKSSEKRLQFYESLLNRLASLPGVVAVAAGSNGPGLDAERNDLEIEGRITRDTKASDQASVVVQSREYLRTINLSLIGGRNFDVDDGQSGREAAIVTRAFAAKYWMNEEALGKRFRFIQNDKPTSWITVVGVAADIVQSNDPDAPPVVYIPLRLSTSGEMTLLIRTVGDPMTVAAPLRSALRELDADLPLSNAQPLVAALNRQHWFVPVFGSVFFIFAVVGLILASVGIYSVIAYASVQRTREIGIRMALGESASGILRLFLGRGVRQLIAGVLFGLIGAVAVTQVLGKSGILLSVPAHDPIVFITITLLLFLIGASACVVPAVRAARLNPLDALRHE